MSHALLRLTKLLPLTVLLPFLTAQSSISLVRTYTESSAIHFKYSPLCNICEKDTCLYTSYSHGELAKQDRVRAESSSIHFKYSPLWDICEKDTCLYTS